MCALAAEAFFPFRPDVPGLRANGAHRVGRTVLFDGPARASTSKPPPWLVAVRDGAPFTLSIRAAATKPSQPQVARIVTVSRDYDSADLMVAQYQSDLIVRVRRRGSDRSGEPPIRVRGVFDVAAPRLIEVRRDSTSVDVAVDGRPSGHLDLGPDGLTSWATDYRLALGDEHLGSRSWQGTLSEAAIEVGGKRWDYLGTGTDIPGRFWYLPERVRGWASPAAAGDGRVIAAHGLAFVPLGALALLTVVPRRRGRAAIVVVAVDLFLLAGKACSAGRHPSAFDFTAQLAGGGAGAWLAYLAVTAKLSKLALLPSRP